MNNKESSFEFNEFSAIDIKVLLLKILSYWKWFLASVIVALIAAKYLNAYQKRIYSLESMITVKDEQNPIFSSSTNIAFNWGGPSDKVETIKTILKSRTHNEKVVQEMQFYIDYLHEGRYRFDDVYGKVPFVVEVDTTEFQLVDRLMKIEFVSENKFSITIDFDEEVDSKLIKYSTGRSQVLSLTKKYQNTFPIGKIQTDLFSFKIKMLDTPKKDQVYYIQFKDFNEVVNHYRKLEISSEKGTSLIKLRLDGANKKRLVDYLNTTVNVLKRDQVAEKIQYAVKTKAYIDTLFNAMADNLKTIEKDLGDFKQKQNIYDLSAQGSAIFEEAIQYDTKAKHLQDRLDYYQSLQNYIRSHIKFDANSIPVPAVVEMEDNKISQSVGVLLMKSKEREALLEKVTTDFPNVKALDYEIDLERTTLLENINNLGKETGKNLERIKKRLNTNQYKLNKLPQKEQKLLSYQRKYAITEQNYNYLKQKSYEAGTAIASNVSDVKIIDNAKDTGQFPIKPNTKFNLLIGVLLALILPLLFILIKDFFNNKIQTVEEVENTSKIPILGVIGKKDGETNLVVLEEPKSVLSESYRALRSNIQFMLKRGAKSNVIIATSSVSGEGKTLTAINLASVFAVSGKKTVLVGVDLRKPKIAEEFDMKSNGVGLVHYLIKKKEPQEIINETKYENLDVIVSGPVPPNPSELLLSEEMPKLMDYLRENYEYIILDAPPIGVVSDAQELFKYVDSVVYMIRQGQTDKGALKMIESKYERGEIKDVSYILNDFSFSKRKGYGYGYGGYGGYGYYVKEKKPFFKRIFSRDP